MMDAGLLLRIPRMWITEVPMRRRVSIVILDRRALGKAGVRALVEISGEHWQLESAKVQKDGAILWRVMTSDRREAEKLVSRLRRAKCAVEPVKLTPVSDCEALTSRQEELIMMAFEKGYFETPREVKLKDLSKLTEVSQATLSEVLRKGQRKIVVDYLSGRLRSE